jgi:hypothetical protein
MKGQKPEQKKRHTAKHHALFPAVERFSTEKPALKKSPSVALSRTREHVVPVKIVRPAPLPPRGVVAAAAATGEEAVQNLLGVVKQEDAGAEVLWNKRGGFLVVHFLVLCRVSS